MGREIDLVGKPDIKVFATLSRKLKVDMQRIYFYRIFMGNTVFHAVSYLSYEDVCLSYQKITIN